MKFFFLEKSERGGGELPKRKNPLRVCVCVCEMYFLWILLFLFFCLTIWIILKLARTLDPLYHCC